MTVSAVQSEGNSYLSVEIEHVTLEPGGSMTVTLRDITPPGTPQPAYIYYMVLILTWSLLQTGAYYFTQGPEKTTIVADSVWADVKDICKGQIEILPFKEHKPAELVNVVVRTDQGDMVALSAVDTAVYILNKNNKLTPQKMFAYMNSYDLACSMGGGRNYQSDHVRKDYSCNNRRRQKRALNHHQDFSDIINRYKNRVEKRCCHDGARLNSLGLSYATTLRNNIKKTRKTYSLARTDGDMMRRRP
ncbi:hypothetical protein J4Q44_G00389460 [Coregonus suidteri]|uniref:Alpha-2-macroglobulin bait region domain-containing protein n=1 Tax=Coregonus suidteri TaxID=861788 RepID=A0AAN8KHG4_9TELE